MMRKEVLNELRTGDYDLVQCEYLHTLNVAYNKWISNIKDIPVLQVKTDRFNIFEDKEKLDSIMNEMNELLT